MLTTAGLLNYRQVLLPKAAIFVGALAFAGCDGCSESPEEPRLDSSGEHLSRHNLVVDQFLTVQVNYNPNLNGCRGRGEEDSPGVVEVLDGSTDDVLGTLNLDYREAPSTGYLIDIPFDFFLPEEGLQGAPGVASFRLRKVCASGVATTPTALLELNFLPAEERVVFLGELEDWRWETIGGAQTFLPLEGDRFLTCTIRYHDDEWVHGLGLFEGDEFLVVNNAEPIEDLCRYGVTFTTSRDYFLGTYRDDSLQTWAFAFDEELNILYEEIVEELPVLSENYLLILQLDGQDLVLEKVDLSDENSETTLVLGANLFPVSGPMVGDDGALYVLTLRSGIETDEYLLVAIDSLEAGNVESHSLGQVEPVPFGDGVVGAFPEARLAGDHLFLVERAGFVIDNELAARVRSFALSDRSTVFEEEFQDIQDGVFGDFFYAVQRNEEVILYGVDGEVSSFELPADSDRFEVPTSNSSGGALFLFGSSLVFLDSNLEKKMEISNLQEMEFAQEIYDYFQFGSDGALYFLTTVAQGYLLRLPALEGAPF